MGDPSNSHLISVLHFHLQQSWAISTFTVLTQTQLRHFAFSRSASSAQ